MIVKTICIDYEDMAGVMFEARGGVDRAEKELEGSGCIEEGEYYFSYNIEYHEVKCSDSFVQGFHLQDIDYDTSKNGGFYIMSQ